MWIWLIKTKFNARLIYTMEFDFQKIERRWIEERGRACDISEIVTLCQLLSFEEKGIGKP